MSDAHGTDEELERRARANAEALREELTETLRVRLAAAGWQGPIMLEETPEWAQDDSTAGYHWFTLNTPAWNEDEGAHVQVPGVPLETVRAEPADGRWPLRYEGEGWAWEELVAHLADEAAPWETFRLNIRAFLADVVAQGGPPEVLEADLEVNVDAASGNREPYWVPVAGSRILVAVSDDVDARGSGRKVFVNHIPLPWPDAVRDFIRRAEWMAAHPDVVAGPGWNEEFWRLEDQGV